MIEVRGLTKRYGPVLAIDSLSFGIRAGSLTGSWAPMDPASQRRCGCSSAWTTRTAARR